MTTSRAAWLHRAVEISLFTWRRAEPGDALDDDERMGWWGDSFPSVAGDKIGSRLWQLRRRSVTPEVLRLAEEYCREALQWMIADDIVAAVDVMVRRGRSLDAPTAQEHVIATVRLTDDRGDTVEVSYDNMWQVLNAVPTSVVI